MVGASATATAPPCGELGGQAVAAEVVVAGGVDDSLAEAEFLDEEVLLVGEAPASVV